MKIIKCDETDIARTAQFYSMVVAYLDNHVNYPRWIKGVYPSEDSVREMTATGSQYICVESAKIIGAFALSDKPQGNFQKGHWKNELPDGSYMILYALAVDPHGVRKGLGSKIIRFAAEKAKEDGYKALRADIVPDNFPARKLFEKNGFEYAGDTDLGLDIGNIPAFSLYELNWQEN